jgi:cell wall-associated NlpC family hydrolase
VTGGRRHLSAPLKLGLIGISIAALGGSVLAAPTAAEPTIDEVRTRVDRLYREAEQASERTHQARLDLRAAQRRLSRLQATLERRRERVAQVRDQVAASVVASYQGGALTTTANLVLSDDPDEFISEMTTWDQYTSAQADVARQLAVQVGGLELDEERAADETRLMRRTERELVEQQDVVDTKAAEAEALLDRLEEQALREQRVSRSGGRQPVPTASVPASGAAAAAVGYALAQVGDAYVYGAAGPDAFDCSGLTMAAYAAAGIGLPHSSGAQMGSGTPVSSSSLAPGDLVFYYSPVSHVGIYVGGGMIVHAANPSTGVRTDPVFSMPFSGAVRPG